MKKLLSPFMKGKFELKNHLVMAPMTRTRALGNQPNEMMVEYYEQRSGAGLIITEATAPVPNALGYPNIPGIFNQSQVDGWKTITDRVHKKGSKIVLQLMHTGRMGHTDNQPENAVLVGPSEIAAAGEIFTTAGMKPHSIPIALTNEGIQEVIAGFVTAAQNAMAAGFDGVELHAANGYLLEQFLNPNVNTRTDEYGGSIENRARLTVELIKVVADAIGKDHVGIRFSPFSTVGDLAAYDEKEVHETYAYLAQQLNQTGIAYIHVAVNGPIPQPTFDVLRNNFSGIIILCNGLTPESGEEALHAGFADLVAFGKSFLANPDFVERIAKDAPLNEVDFNTFYGTTAKGYIDYPILELTQLKYQVS
ncbi:MAG TPA: alkene reductase [Edaphocola sp.]|nr:alkene reductase [Edaphocola sp.]